MEETNITPDAPDLDDVPAADDIPRSDLPSPTEQPETQGADPVIAELGEEGNGDLAPEDLSPEDLTGDEDEPAGRLDDGPTDLRTELPSDQ